MYQFRYFFGVALILIGLFLGLLGRKLWVIAIFIISLILTIGIILLIFYTTFLKENTAGWVAWTVIGCSLILGVVLGLVMTKLQRLGAAIIAGWGGFMLGLVLNEAVLYLLENTYVFWCVCIGCALVAAVLVFVAYNHAIILATSLVGSYFFVRGISLYAGGWPNEYLILKQIKAGVITSEPWTFYVYLASILVATIICAVVQYRALARMDEYEKHPYEKLR